MWGTDIFHKHFLSSIFVRLNSPSPGSTQSGTSHSKLCTQECLFNRLGCLGYCKAAASLSGRKITKYLVHVMVQNALEVSMEVPITDIKYLASTPLSVLFTTRRLPPQGDKGTVLVPDSTQGQKTRPILIVQTTVMVFYRPYKTLFFLLWLTIGTHFPLSR